MTKKCKLVVGTPELRRPSNPNRPINSPVTGTPKFADFPALKPRGKAFAGGPIYLREGKHRGPNNGYGFQHIWQEHFSAEVDPKEAELQVATFVATILVVGSSIHYEGGIGSQVDRAVIWRHANGIAILEERTDGQGSIIYTVVTAFKTGGPKGVLIGKL